MGQSTLLPKKGVKIRKKPKQEKHERTNFLLGSHKRKAILKMQSPSRLLNNEDSVKQYKTTPTKREERM